MIRVKFFVLMTYFLIKNKINVKHKDYFIF